MASYFKPELNARGGLPSGRDAKNYLALEPSMDFFTEAYKHSPAHFSTRMGTRPRRDPDIFPTPRRITQWSHTQIKQAADTIRTYCFPIFKHIRQPVSWDDLHNYWDTSDLWDSGAQNLWNVLQHIYWETQRELPEVTAEVRTCVEEWAGVLLKSPKRQERLLKWEEDEDGYDILGVFQPEELKDLDGLDMYWLSLVRDVLKCARGHIRRGTYCPPRPTTHKPAPSSTTEMENRHGFAGSEWSFHTTGQRPQPAVAPQEDMDVQCNNGEAAKETCVVDRTSAAAIKARRSSSAEGASDGESTLATVLDKAVTDSETQAHDKTPKASTASLGTPNAQNQVHPREEVHCSASHRSDLVVPPLTRNSFHVASATQVFYDKPTNAPGGLCTPDGQPNSLYYPRSSAYQAAPHANGMRGPGGHQGFSSHAHKHKPRQPSELPVEPRYGVSTTYFGSNGSRAPVTSAYGNGYARPNNYSQYNGNTTYGPVFVHQGQNRFVKPQYPPSAPLGGLPQQMATVPQAGRQTGNPRHQQEGTGFWPQGSNRHQFTNGFHQLPNQQHATCHQNATPRVSKDPDCLNAHLRKTAGPSHQYNYVPCSCDFCDTKDRTLYVGPFQPGELSSPDCERKVFNAFSNFGEIEDLSITVSRQAAFVRFTGQNPTHEAKRHLNGKIFDFCDHPIRVNHAHGSQFSRTFQPRGPKLLNNPTLNEFDVSGAARPAHIVAKTWTGPPHGQAKNALLAKQSASVPGVNDVLSHMDHPSSIDENAKEDTVMLSGATSPGQGGITQSAPKIDEEIVTSLDTDKGFDKPLDGVCDVAMLDQSGEALDHGSKNTSEDMMVASIPNSDIEHDDAVDMQEGPTSSQLSSRTITPTPIPRNQQSSRALASPTDNASDQPSEEQEDQASGAEGRILDYGTVRRYLNKRPVNYQPIPMDWAASPSGNLGNTCQATGFVDVSPSGTHNSTFPIQSVLSQDIVQSSPHKKRNGKGKSKGKQSQQKLHEKSSNYVLPAAFYQPQPPGAALSQQLPSQP
ncbi:hypothetical protein PG985_012280 [Apiospora marii]|uniref:uncharacterized protein n=1 Tax=Apiospora marii TaxID=335849 RepID=UPI00312DFB5C